MSDQVVNCCSRELNVNSDIHIILLKYLKGCTAVEVDKDKAILNGPTLWAIANDGDAVFPWLQVSCLIE